MRQTGVGRAKKKAGGVALLTVREVNETVWESGAETVSDTATLHRQERGMCSMWQENRGILYLS